jgi:transposase-like protein
MMYVNYPLSLRNVEDLLHERGIDVCYETVVSGGTGLPHVAAKIRAKRVQRMRSLAAEFSLFLLASTACPLSAFSLLTG